MIGLVPSMITRTWALNPTASAFGSDVISALTAEIETAGVVTTPDPAGSSHLR